MPPRVKKEPKVKEKPQVKEERDLIHLTHF
jgi:hypothetical protein